MSAEFLHNLFVGHIGFCISVDFRKQRIVEFVNVGPLNVFYLTVFAYAVFGKRFAFFGFGCEFFNVFVGYGKSIKRIVFFFNGNVPFAFCRKILNKIAFFVFENVINVYIVAFSNGCFVFARRGAFNRNNIFGSVGPVVTFNRLMVSVRHIAQYAEVGVVRIR